jgi:hypothetical protein
MLAIFLGGKLYQRRERVIHPPPGMQPIAIASFLFCCIGLVLVFGLFLKSGFFTGQMSHVRFLKERDESYLRIYMYLIPPSFALLSLYEKRARVSLLIFLSFAALNLVGGSRRMVLYLLIIYLSARILRGKRFRYKILTIVFAVSLVLGVAAGLWRSGMSLPGPGQGWFVLERAVFMLTEYARPYTSLPYYMEHPEPLLFGKSFLGGFQMAVPSFLAPYAKTPSLGTEFAEKMDRLVGGEDRATGLGFSPVAELLLNFPIPFMFLFFYLFAAGIRMLSFRLQETNFSYVSVWLCTAMYTIARGGFQDVVTSTLWSLLFGTIVLFCGMMLRSAGPAPRYGRSHETLSVA